MTSIQPASKMKLVSVTVIATVLALLFSFVGAPLLRVLQNVAGSVFYWISGLLMFAVLLAAQMGPVAFLVFAIWVSVGIYGDLEARGRAGFGSFVTATLAGTALAVLGPIAFFRSQGLDAGEALKKSLESALKQVPSTQGSSSWLSGVTIDAEFLIQQLPSMMAILILSSLAFALILDRRIAWLAGLRFERVASNLRLLEFRMPDWMIWVAMFSFLFSFLKVEIPLVSIIALNLFNTLVAAYFFQGLAILESTFAYFRVGFLIRLAVYLFVVGQLFFVLSLIGLIDYWVDFRRRLRGSSSAGKNQNNGEHV